jgi:hypothetical protein
VSQSGELTNLSDIGSGRLLIVKPYLLGGVRSNALVGTQMLHTGGLDFKYGIRSNVIANVTLNTDFAEADVDPQQFNITPFRQFIPEKRQFFLENSGIFQFAPGAQTFELPNTLFFSRQIGIDPVSGEQVPLDAGAKLTGRMGGLDFGVLDAQTGRSGFNPSANYFVARADQKFLRESYVGAMVVNKERRIHWIATTAREASMAISCSLISCFSTGSLPRRYRLCPLCGATTGLISAECGIKATLFSSARLAQLLSRTTTPKLGSLIAPTLFSARWISNCRPVRSRDPLASTTSKRS